MRRVRAGGVALLVAVLVAVIAVAPASAQGWMYQPNTGNSWHCGDYGSEFLCY